MPAPTASLNSAGVVTQAGSYFLSVGSFSPPSDTDRALALFVAGADTDTDSRTPAAQYDNSSVSPGNQTQATAGNGSFEWDQVFADCIVGDDTYLDGRASSAFLGISNVSEDGALFPIDLADVDDGDPLGDDTDSGTGTSSSVTVGGATFSHSWSGSQNYAHLAVAWNGTDGTSVIVVDLLVVWGAPTITVDSSATSLGSATDSTGDVKYSAVCTYQVVTGDAEVDVDTPSATWTGVAASVTPGEVTVNVGVASSAWAGADSGVTPGEVTVDVDAPSAAWTGVGAPASVTTPGLTADVDVGVGTWSPVAATPEPGEVEVGVIPGAALWAGVGASVAPGEVEVAVDVGTAAWAGVTPAAEPGAVTADAAVASAAWSATALDAFLLDSNAPTWLELAPVAVELLELERVDVELLEIEGVDVELLEIDEVDLILLELDAPRLDLLTLGAAR